MTELRVRGLVVRHRDSVAVDGVDVSLASGEQLVVLGSSGAGKTCLECARALPPSRGAATCSAGPAGGRSPGDTRLRRCVIG